MATLLAEDVICATISAFLLTINVQPQSSQEGLAEALTQFMKQAMEHKNVTREKFRSTTLLSGKCSFRASATCTVPFLTSATSVEIICVRFSSEQNSEHVLKHCQGVFFGEATIVHAANGKPKNTSHRHAAVQDMATAKEMDKTYSYTERKTVEALNNAGSCGTQKKRREAGVRNMVVETDEKERTNTQHFVSVNTKLKSKG